MRRFSSMLPSFIVIVVFILTISLFKAGTLKAEKKRLSIILNKTDIFDTLVMVPCHSAYLGMESKAWTEPYLLDESNWYLWGNQKGLVGNFVQHLRAGIEETAKLERSLLIFSGGQTRPIGPRSEAQTYWYIGKYNSWFGHGEIETRAAVEEFAMDSLDNLLFSICRFYQITGNYPNKIIVTGFPFKRDRFVNVHRAAIRFPRDRFQYISVPEPKADSDLRTNPNFWDPIVAGEGKTADRFRKDPFACFDEVLVAKKIERNIYNTYHGYEQSCPQLKSLFSACTSATNGYDLDPLPWTSIS